MDEIRELLAQRAEIQARMSQIPFDGSIEVKETGSGKYLYARARVAGKNTSTYIDVYSEELHAMLLKQAIELRSLKKSLRQVNRDLARLGYEAGELTPQVLLNLDFARANIKTMIYGQAVLEGVSTTFPQTEEILENGIISGVQASDVQKILNLKHAWEFVLDADVVSCPTDLAILRRIAALVNEGFYETGGRIRVLPVSIGGCSYAPPIPTEDGISRLIADTLGEREDDAATRGMRLCLRLMRAQPFIDGNKRTAVIFANHYLIAQGAGLLAIPETEVGLFRSMLVDYYESNDDEALCAYMREICLRSIGEQ